MKKGYYNYEMINKFNKLHRKMTNLLDILLIIHRIETQLMKERQERISCLQ